MKVTNNINQVQNIFEILVRENADMLMTYLHAVVKNGTVAEDLFQETMLTAWKKLPDYDHSRPFGPWLRGIASKLIQAHYRQAKNDFLLSDVNMLDYFNQQVQHIDERTGDTWDEKITALMHCIDALSDQQRQAINQRYFEHKTTEQIVQSSNESIEAIRKRLQRARARLLECLRRKKVVMEIST